MIRENEEYVHNFDLDTIEKIIKKALTDGYKIKETIWYDSYEREEGCPSGEYILGDDDIKINKDDELEYTLPDDPGNGGCAEWNFVKNDEYICFYHIESSDEYICQEAIDTFENNK